MLCRWAGPDGVFQLESTGMTGVCTGLKPEEH